jgi:hypothetical protein
MKYYQVLINSENRQQAADILDHLITERLVIGGPVDVLSPSSDRRSTL